MGSVSHKGSRPISWIEGGLPGVEGMEQRRGHFVSGKVRHRDESRRPQQLGVQVTDGPLPHLRLTNELSGAICVSQREELAAPFSIEDQARQ